MNVRAPTEDKNYDIMDECYEELEREFYQFPKYHMKILLGDFNANIGREYTFETTIGNESLHEVSDDDDDDDDDDDEVGVVNFATSKILVVKSTMFPLRMFIKTLARLTGKQTN
jgi:hypothetical protein